jgi:ribosomal protein S18 acetylase RimI-like enzyme
MMGNGVRLARLADAAAVQSVKAAAYKAAYLAAAGYVPKPGYEDYRARIAGGDVYVAVEAGVVAGVLVLETRPDHVLVYSVAVRPGAQGRGLGRRLLAVADEVAGAAGVAEVRLFTNVRMIASVRLYRNCGFRVAGTRPHPNREGEVLVDMVKALASCLEVRRQWT